MINKVVLVGRLTRDPELRATSSGKSVTSVTVALDNQTKNPDGTKSTSFIPVTAWGNSADILCKYTRKGSLVGVEGRLNQRSYKRNDGTNAQVIEVIADRIALLESKGASSSNVETNNGYEEDVVDSSDLETADLAEEDLPF
jgi:single-strand DNA-binding protein